MTNKAVLFLSHLLITTLLCTYTSAQSGDFSLQEQGKRGTKKVIAEPALKGNGIKIFLIGKNYRKEWITEVKVPILNLKTDMGGLRPEKEGGGKQTRTLHLKDARGNDWVLRSVRKYPEKVTPPEVKGTFIEKLLHDGISGSYPYSVLSAGTLTRAAGIPYMKNTLVYVPDDPALGEFREKYKNNLALLEKRTIQSPEEKQLGTEELVPELFKSADHTVDQTLVLRARLLDNFMMDFDRHSDQWKWLQKDSGGRKYYLPIPKDRDQVFFNAEGLLAKMFGRKGPMGVFQGFRSKVKDITSFNYSARDFDRTFLTEPDEQTWSREIDRLLASITDKVIDSALAKQPPEIHPFHTKQITKVLKDKKRYFKEDMMHYYRFLSSVVSVAGSNGDEKFTISGQENGSLLVKVEKLEGNDVSFTLFNRLFDPAVTKEVRIYGLEGDDRFVINSGRSPIKIRLIGGPGEDDFRNEGSRGKIWAYDVSFEQNSFTGSKGLRKKISADPLNNEYRRLGTIYNSSGPGIFIELTGDGGFLIGPSFRLTRSGFRKEPYAARHQLLATRTLTRPGFYHMRYTADFFSLFKNTDLLIRSDLKMPTSRTNFFGYGNNTRLPGDNAHYYHARYHLFDMSVMARHPLKPWLELSYGPALQYFRLLSGRNDRSYIRTIYFDHEPEDKFIKGSWYAGAELRLQLNTRNHPLIPAQGIHATVFTRPMKGIGSNTFVNQTGASLSLYSDVLLKDRIILATSFGINHNFGEFEVPQAQYLGYEQNLRGYRFQRFAGRTNAYNNSEIRINFGDRNFYLFRGPFGIIGFYDTGRVWMDGESSDTWHRGYGGGLWFAPFSKLVVTTLISSSKEEKIFPLVNFGFQF